MRDRSEREVIAYLAFMGILLAFGIDVALPAFDEIRAAFDLGDDPGAVTLIVTLYFLGMASGQVVYGPLADRFGRAPVLRAGVLVYALGALGSTLAPSLGLLYASRLVWGLGAAAPGVLRSTIARDLYAGDQMARVISIMMAFFLIGPVFVPLLGEAILLLGSWRLVFAAGLILAGLLVAWTFRFGETLDPANRRPLDPSATVLAFRTVIGTRSTVGYTLAMTFGFGSFIIYLGSAQPIFDTIYRRADQFAYIFGAAGILMAAGFFSVNRFIAAHGAHRVSVVVVGAALAISVAQLTGVLAADGRPGFWAWIVPVAVANALVTLLTPTCYSLALEPMGELAGTASGVIGLTATAGASLLAALVGARIDETVTPMVGAYVVYGAISLAFLVWAGRARQAEEAARAMAVAS